METASERTRNKNHVQMETFAERLAQAIERSGLGRPEFAARSGVGTSALAKWLSGKLTPKSDQLYSLAKTAGVTMEWLIAGIVPNQSQHQSSVKDDTKIYGAKSLDKNQLEVIARELESTLSKVQRLLG